MTLKKRIFFYVCRVYLSSYYFYGSRKRSDRNVVYQRSLREYMKYFLGPFRTVWARVWVRVELVWVSPLDAEWSRARGVNHQRNPFASLRPETGSSSDRLAGEISIWNHVWDILIRGLPKLDGPGGEERDVQHLGISYAAWHFILMVESREGGCLRSGMFHSVQTIVNAGGKIDRNVVYLPSAYNLQPTPTDVCLPRKPTTYNLQPITVISSTQCHRTRCKLIPKSARLYQLVG